MFIFSLPIFQTWPLMRFFISLFQLDMKYFPLYNATVLPFLWFWLPWNTFIEWDKLDLKSACKTLLLISLVSTIFGTQRKDGFHAPLLRSTKRQTITSAWFSTFLRTYLNSQSKSLIFATLETLFLY